MTPVAAPLSTLVPRKQMFVCSIDETPVRVSVVSCFSTGSDSPVSVAWMMNKSFAAISRTSPGIMSPADNFTTSPGTSCCSGISFCCPSRSTVAVTLIIALSLAAALPARVSCTRRKATPRITIASITVPPGMSSVAYERIERTVSSTTSGLRTAVQSRCSHSCLRSWATSFGPYFVSRASASVSVRPIADELRDCKTAALSRVAASLRASTVRVEFNGLVMAMLLSG